MDLDEAGISMDQALQQMNGNIVGPVPDFFDDHFPYLSFISQDPSLQNVIEEAPLHAWSAHEFVPWFAQFAAKKSYSASRKWEMRHYYTSYGEGVDIFLLAYRENDKAGEPSVRAIGTYCPDIVSYKDGLARLFILAHKTFSRHPLQRFLHATYIHGKTVECWIFDRRGMYCSNATSLNNGFARLTRILSWYHDMTDAEAGIADFIVQDEVGKRYLQIDDNTARYQTNPIRKTFQGPLFGKGTMHYNVQQKQQQQYSMKLLWRLAGDGLVSRIANLKQAKQIPGLATFEFVKDLTHTLTPSKSMLRAPGLMLLDDDQEEPIENQQGILRYSTRTEFIPRPRILTCICISQAGRPLRSFSTPTELLQVFIDAIKTHWTLFTELNILHGNISENSIIILTDSKGLLLGHEEAGLVDGLLPSSKNMSRLFENPTFAAIDVLKNKPHTYRSDLESFLYLLLWTIICQELKTPPEGSRLCGWITGTLDDCIEAKTSAMEEAGFSQILQEFRKEYDLLKGVAYQWRLLLFPQDNPKKEQDERLYTNLLNILQQSLRQEHELN